MWYGTVVVAPEKRFHKVKQIENVAVRTYVFSNYAKVLIKKTTIAGLSFIFMHVFDYWYIINSVYFVVLQESIEISMGNNNAFVLENIYHVRLYRCK